MNHVRSIIRSARLAVNPCPADRERGAGLDSLLRYFSLRAACTWNETRGTSTSARATSWDASSRQWSGRRSRSSRQERGGERGRKFKCQRRHLEVACAVPRTSPDAHPEEDRPVETGSTTIDSPSDRSQMATIEGPAHLVPGLASTPGDRIRPALPVARVRLAVVGSAGTTSRAGVAQLAERQPSKLHVAGSRPVSRSKSTPLDVVIRTVIPCHRALRPSRWRLSTTTGRSQAAQPGTVCVPLVTALRRASFRPHLAVTPGQVPRRGATARHPRA